MNFYFHPLADEELDEAVRYYEESQISLGLEFAEEVYATIIRICEIRMHGHQYRRTRGVAS